ncbi:hypothetical protein [Mycolicibacterium thermoresistibile]
MTDDRPTDSAARDWVAELQRWEDSGAHWRVLFRAGDTVTVGLFTCDGGEEVDHFTSGDAALLRHIGDRSSSEE